MALDAAKGVNTAVPQKVVDTKVEGDLNTTVVQVTGQQPNSVHTEVRGTGNATSVTVNNYNSYGSSAGQVAHGANAASPHKTRPAQSPTPQPAQKTEPKKAPEAKPVEKQHATEPPMSARETAQRAEQLAKAANNDGMWMGTNEEEFYNAVTTVPGGETTESVNPNNTKTMDQRVFLSKENLVKLDKYLKTHQLASTSMSSAGGIRSYINAEFDITDRNDFYNNKMRELTNLLDKYGIK